MIMRKLKKGFIAVMLLSLVFTFGGCSGANNTSNSTSSNASAETKYPLTITDDFGKKVTIEKEPAKIVSLAPSNTEILFALGLGSKVAGRSENDNYPAEASSIPVVGGFSGPNTESIIKLAPEVVFAFKGSLTDEAQKLLESSGIKVVTFNPANIEGVYSDIKVAGEICNVQAKAKELTDSMQAKREGILSKIANVKSKKVIVDIGGFYSAGQGSFIDSMLKELKADNIAATTTGEWPQLSVEQIVSSDPDVYISLYTSLDELKAVSGLSSTTAFKNGNVIVIESETVDNDVMQRPGPRVIDGLEIYAKTIYPEAFK
jgi:iron complex transport system substrate-binding protein